MFTTFELGTTASSERSAFHACFVIVDSTRASTTIAAAAQFSGPR
jgi:aerobic-type carbon monoxide dehydrogenase small subunit (CoxS/CutS family)